MHMIYLLICLSLVLKQPLDVEISASQKHAFNLTNHTHSLMLTDTFTYTDIDEHTYIHYHMLSFLPICLALARTVARGCEK